MRPRLLHRPRRPSPRSFLRLQQRLLGKRLRGRVHAQGDIPDNQQFLSFKNSQAGYSISYPRVGRGPGTAPTSPFRTRATPITIKVASGSQPTHDIGCGGAEAGGDDPIPA